MLDILHVFITLASKDETVDLRDVARGSIVWQRPNNQQGSPCCDRLFGSSVVTIR